MGKSNTKTGLELAVIGISGKFSGTRNIDEFWHNLKNGIETITFFSDSELEEVGISKNLLKDPNYVKAMGVVADKEYFDYSFFGLFMNFYGYNEFTHKKMYHIYYI